MHVELGVGLAVTQLSIHITQDSVAAKQEDAPVTWSKTEKDREGWGNLSDGYFL